MRENIKVGVNLNVKKSSKVEERSLKQNSFKLSFESRSVHNFSNMTWETAPCQRSCIAKASLACCFTAAVWHCITYTVSQKNLSRFNQLWLCFSSADFDTFTTSEVARLLPLIAHVFICLIVLLSTTRRKILRTTTQPSIPPGSVNEDQL